MAVGTAFPRSRKYSVTIICSSKHSFSFLLSSAFPSFRPQFSVYPRPFHDMLFILLSRVRHVSFCSPCPSVLCTSTRSPPTLACAMTSVFPLIHRLSYSIFFSRGFTLLWLHPESGRCTLLRNSIACTLMYMSSYPAD